MTSFQTRKTDSVRSKHFGVFGEDGNKRLVRFFNHERDVAPNHMLTLFVLDRRIRGLMKRDCASAPGWALSPKDSRDAISETSITPLRGAGTFVNSLWVMVSSMKIAGGFWFMHVDLCLNDWALTFRVPTTRPSGVRSKDALGHPGQHSCWLVNLDLSRHRCSRPLSARYNDHGRQRRLPAEARR